MDERDDIAVIAALEINPLLIFSASFVGVMGCRTEFMAPSPPFRNRNRDPRRFSEDVRAEPGGDIAEQGGFAFNHQVARSDRPLYVAPSGVGRRTACPEGCVLSASTAPA